jgi:hypothetical protein
MGRTAARFVGRAAALVLTLVGLVAACSSGSEQGAPKTTPDEDANPIETGTFPDSADSDACVAATCSSKGAECGQILNGCGGVVECGACVGNAFCGGAGSNKCGSSPCIPKTCSTIGNACGLQFDGCGAYITCTACQFPDTCGGGGTPDQCGCTPVTCQGQGITCGQASDGCGGTLDCGTCTNPAVCGNGVCESGENGSSCAQDCCDAQTPCDQTKQNGGVLYCRQINGSAYTWYTEAQGISFCDQPSEVCATTFSCGGQSGICAGTPGQYVFGPCPVCGDGKCDWPEDGTACPQDCCDASTPCDQTKQNGGVLYCRQFNGGAFDWYTEQQAILLCDEQSEICTQTFACGGQSGVCASIPGGWIFGTC